MTDLTGLDVGRADLSDAPQLLGLINFIQPHVPWTEVHLRWQFFESPAGPARLHVIRDGDAIVSLYAAIRQRILVEGEVKTAWMIQDVMSHPAYRGRGFLHHLGQLCLNELRQHGDAGYTFPNKLSEGSFRRTGWHESGRVPLRTLSLNGLPSQSRTSTGLVESVTVFDGRHATAWSAADVGVGVHRDVEFLSWRYGKPGQTYHKFALGGDAGFLVLKVYRGSESTTVHICDLVLRKDSRELVGPALAFVLGFAFGNGAARVTAWLPESHPYGPAFDGAGLILSREHDRFMFVEGPVTGKPWHVTQGDSDVY